MTILYMLRTFAVSSPVNSMTTLLVELIVNGKAVETKRIVADGSQVNLVFETKIERSSWVALRILPSSHT
ncbi:MAG: hypothetical protein RLZ84_227, partial [Actinomycetota bacterium]